jgi:hypothetical protein
MAKKKEDSRKSKKLKDNVHRYRLKALIDEDQRQYMEGVREWLDNPLRNKGKVVGGPV